MAKLRIPDEYGIVSERARQREVFGRFLERQIDDILGSASCKARIAREVDARVKREVDALIERKTRERLAELERMEVPRGPAVGDVLAIVAEVTGVGVPDLVGPRRNRRFAWPRFLAVHILLAVRPDLSFPMIGKVLGGRDHTTAMHARTKFLEIMDLAPVCNWLADERVQAILAQRPEVVSERRRFVKHAPLAEAA